MEIKIRHSLKKNITSPDAVGRVLSRVLSAECAVDRAKEHFWTIGLNTRNTVQYAELVSLGTLNASLVHPREVFRFAIMKGVAAIILAHNHPSGEVDPSDDDIALTRRLTEAGKLLGIEVLDHVIVAARDRLSFKERGLL